MLRFAIPTVLLFAVVAIFANVNDSEISLFPEAQTGGLTRVKFDSPNDEDEKAAAAKKAYAALDAKFKARMAEFSKEVKALKTKQEQMDLLVASNPGREYAAEFLKLAKDHPNTKSAVNAILFAISQTAGKEKNEAMTLLIEKYPTKVRLDKIAASLKKEIPSTDVETLYQLMCKNAKGDKIRASVMYDYGKYINQIPVFRRTIAYNPAVKERMPKEQVDYIFNERTDEQNKPLVEALETLIAEYGDLKYDRLTYGERAKRELFEIQHLQIGDPAPEIEGKDLDGIPFKLSDYRGKVVMLDFWGQWCPPCRAMYQHEREIVQAMADKPFVLLGVNSDPNINTAKQAVRDSSLSWRHFWNGKGGTRGEIAAQWNIEGWPTFYLIDEDGVIRHKEVLGDQIDRGIEELMAEMGYDIKFSNSAGVQAQVTSE